MHRAAVAHERRRSQEDAQRRQRPEQGVQRQHAHLASASATVCAVSDQYHVAAADVSSLYKTFRAAGLLAVVHWKTASADCGRRTLRLTNARHDQRRLPTSSTFSA